MATFESRESCLSDYYYVYNSRLTICQQVNAYLHISRLVSNNDIAQLMERWMNDQGRINVLGSDLQTEHLKNVLQSINRSPLVLDQLYEVSADFGNVQNI